MASVVGIPLLQTAGSIATADSSTASNDSSNGPCVRFEGIQLDFSSYSGCQFDFAKDGNLVLTFDGYRGTVTLKSNGMQQERKPQQQQQLIKVQSHQQHHHQARPLCVTRSEAGSLGVLEDAEADDVAAMDQMDYDIALSQLEQGESPKPISVTSGNAAEGVILPSSPFPATMMFESPSAVRQACEGKHGDDDDLDDVKKAIAVDCGGAEKNDKKDGGDDSRPSTLPSFAALVSPSTSDKKMTNAINDSPSASTRKDATVVTTTAAAAAAAAAAILGKAVTLDGTTTAAQEPSTSPSQQKQPIKNKRGRRARGADSSPSPSFTVNSSAGTTGGSSAKRRRSSSGKENEDVHHRGRRDSSRSAAGHGVDVVSADETASCDNDDAESCSSHPRSPKALAAAEWIASTASSRPAPLSRSARAEVVEDCVPNGVSAPMGRWGHSATMMTQSEMLILGGQADDDAHQATLGDLYKFNFETGKWSRPMNCDSIPRAWHTASFIPGKNLLVIFGGERTVDGCPECLDDIMVLDTDIDLLYPPAISGKSPTARSGHSAAIIGTDLVVFGGVRGRKWQNSVAVLDTERWHWRHPTIDGSNPAPRSYHSATVVGNLMVVFGGNNQNESFDKVHVLDTSKPRWVWSCPEVVGAAPASRTGHSAVLLPDGHTIVIHGGWDPEDEGGVKNFGDAYLLNTRLWEWSRGPERLLGAGDAGLRVGHSALLAVGEPARGDEGHPPEVEASSSDRTWKTVFFGGQDGAGVRSSELALLSL